MSSSMKVISGEISSPKNTRTSWVDLPDGIAQKIRAFVGVSNDYPAFAQTCQAWSRVVRKNGVVDLSDSPQLTDAQFIALIDRLKTKIAISLNPESEMIHTLFLSRCISLTQKAMVALRGFSLSSIDIQGSLIPEECLYGFYQAKCLKLNGLVRSYSSHSIDDVIAMAHCPIHKIAPLETLYIGKRRISLPKTPVNPPARLKKADF